VEIMAGQAPSRLSIAILLFLIVGLLYEIDTPITAQFTSYLEFVLTTDFDLNFAVKPINHLQQIIHDWDLAVIRQSLPRIATGW